MKGIRLRSVLAISSLLCIACSSIGDYPYMKEGQPHAEAIVSAVSREWNADELISVADPRLLQVASQAQITAMVAACSQLVGRVKSQNTFMGSTGVDTSFSGTFASYVIDLEGDKGAARVTIRLQKVGDRWNVLGFWFQGQPSPSAAVQN